MKLATVLMGGALLCVSLGCKEMPHIVGGYESRPVDHADVQEAAVKAVELLQSRQGDPGLRLIQIKSAESQVVAGLNFRLELELQTQSGVKTAKVVVYRDLQNHFQLTSVEGL